MGDGSNFFWGYFQKMCNIRSLRLGDVRKLYGKVMAPVVTSAVGCEEGRETLTQWYENELTAQYVRSDQNRKSRE